MVSLVVALLALAAAGCRGDAPPPDPPASAPGEGILMVAAPAQPEIQRTIEQWNARQPGARATLAYPLGDAAQKADIAQTILDSRSDAIDIFLLEPHWVRAFAEAGWLEPVDGAVPDAGEFDAPTLDAVRVRGPGDREPRLYGLPASRQGVLLFYRTEAFPVPGADAAVRTTAARWSTLRPLLEGLRREGGAPPLIIDGRDAGLALHTAMRRTVERAEAAFHRDAVPRAAEAPPSEPALRLVQELIHEGLASPLGPLGATLGQEASRQIGRFTLGESHLLLAASTVGGVVRNLTAIGVLPPPQEDDAAGKPARIVRRDEVWVLSRHSTRKAAAIEFMRFATSRDVQARALADSGTVPSRRGLLDEKASAFARAVAAALDAGAPEVYPLAPGTAILLEERLHEALGTVTLPFAERMPDVEKALRLFLLRLDYEETRPAPPRPAP